MGNKIPLDQPCARGIVDFLGDGGKSLAEKKSLLTEELSR